MNYPTIKVIEPTSGVVIAPEKLVDLKKEKKDGEAFEGIGDIRAGGNMRNTSIFLADSRTLGKYDFVLAIDSTGCLVVVPIKK